MLALRMLEGLLPFPLQDMDRNNDGTRLTAPLERGAKCTTIIAQSSSRKQKSDDLACVQQKNERLICRVVGRQHQESRVRTERLVKLYRALGWSASMPPLVPFQGDVPRGGQAQTLPPPTTRCTHHSNSCCDVCHHVKIKRTAMQSGC